MFEAATCTLRHARLIADYARTQGVLYERLAPRPAITHLGAALADAVLQSGLNYDSVVRPRVNRIHLSYPEAALISGLLMVLRRDGPAQFLRWQHDAKISRFLRIIELLEAENVEDSGDLQRWLRRKSARLRLLEIEGVGPKTFDYMCCLVGLDHVAVDRHIKSFALEAGVKARGYEEIQMAVSFAADLLGLGRRDFDNWIWRRLSQSSQPTQQLCFF